MANIFKRTSDRRNKLVLWRIKYKGADGEWHTATGCTDKVKTQQLARSLEDEATLECQGLRDPKELRCRQQASRPVSEHMEEFHAAIKAKNGSSNKDASKHADSTRTYIKWVAESLGATKIADLTPSAVQGVIAQLIDQGRSLRTCNAYITAVKGFTRWLWRDGRIVSDELAHLTKYNEETTADVSGVHSMPMVY